mmetsp:Transcript_20375/g.36442  ORF Transcript_20375/g.36442 Transcript_20375/m.36442 type:complete len:213 (-) Transcript_20375:760-1398(-)
MEGGSPCHPMKQLGPLVMLVPEKPSGVEHPKVSGPWHHEPKVLVPSQVNASTQTAAPRNSCELQQCEGMSGHLDSQPGAAHCHCSLSGFSGIVQQRVLKSRGCRYKDEEVYLVAAREPLKGRPHSSQHLAESAPGGTVQQEAVGKQRRSRRCCDRCHPACGRCGEHLCQQSLPALPLRPASLPAKVQRLTLQLSNQNEEKKLGKVPLHQPQS